MNKLAVITGGTKGIGKALVEKFAKEGFEVITCARNTKDLNSLKQNINQNLDKNIRIFGADLSEKNQIQDFLKFIKSSAQKVDVLINNTGVFIPGKIHQEEEGVLEKQIQTNLYSAYHICRGIIPGMISQKEGAIFNICSTASVTPYINGGSYCISKYALYGMTKVLREELKEHNIRVTAVLPGATLTASWAGTDLPPERFMKPEDVADLIWSVYKLSNNTVVEDLLLRPQLGDIS
ncbi:MAG: SDR family oxidoreductase [Cytophagaceae bacterium]|nr:SDR family oxidoreductase [Cytophagaceae bacterium]